MRSFVQMRFWRASFRVFFVLACFFNQCSATATARNGETDGAPLNVASSNLTISRVYSQKIQTYAGVLDQDCIVLTNLTAMAVTSVRVGFALVDSAGVPSSKIKILSDNEPTNPGATFLYCLDQGYPARTRDAHLVAFISFARFADGHAWLLAPPILGKSLSQASDPLRVTEAGVYLPSLECATVSNASDKTIRRARIVFRHYAQDGSVINTYTIDVTLTLRPGESLSANCKDIELTGEPSIDRYIVSRASGSAELPPPHLFFRGNPFSLGALVSEVDFTDGSSWRASP
jgi:hypothetical protein